MGYPALHLYYWPSSSASQKALLALEEKQLKYSKTVVDLSEGEQMKPWFLRINPAGQVPTLKIGDRYVPDSEAIFDAIQELNTGGPAIVPDIATPEGKEVQRWRKRFTDDLNLYLITYGTITNPDVAEGPLELPKAYKITKDDWKAKNDKSAKYLESLKVKNPDLVTVLDKKIEQMLYMGDPNNLTADKVKQELEKLDKLFDDIEVQLRKTRQENIIEHWLCGPNITAPDMTLIMFIGRLSFLSYFSRFVNPEKRPAVVEYWDQACRRPCVQKVVLGSKANLMKYFFARMAKRVALGSTAAAGVVGLAVFVAHKYRS